MQNKQKYIIDNIDDIISIQNKLKENTENSESEYLILLYLIVIFLGLFVKFSYDIVFYIIGKLNPNEILLFLSISIPIGLYLLTISYKIFKNKKIKNFKHNKISNNVYKKIFNYYYEQVENKKKHKNSENFINSLTEKEIYIIENLNFVDMKLNIEHNKIFEHINNLNNEEKIKNKDKIIKLINNKNLYYKTESNIIEELKTFYLNNQFNNQNISVNKNNIVKSI